jgi:transcriptional regulator with XRE-family HTH domain
MKPNLKTEIGLRLKAARSRAGMTQEVLAEGARRTVETISKIERGQAFPSMDTLEALARVLQAPLREFFPDPSEPKRSAHRLALELRAREVLHGLGDAELEIAIDQMSALGTRGLRRKS